MKDATIRSIVRWIHIVLAIPIIGYIYSPFEQIPNVRPRVSVCLPSDTSPFGIVDVERPRRSTASYESGWRLAQPRTRTYDLSIDA